VRFRAQPSRGMRFAQPRAMRALASLALLAAILSAGSARADDSTGLTVQWAKLVDVIHRGSAALLPEKGWQLGREPSGVPSDELRWVGLSPHVALIARDWDAARVLVGHLSPTDQIRLSQSSRMFVTRLRLTDGRISPFAQVGLGQWRIDTDLMPVLPRDVELAGQLGGGFELTLGRLAAVAVEVDSTMLYRERREPQMVSEPRLWGTFLVARAQF
jgi:hypothetical protein